MSCVGNPCQHGGTCSSVNNLEMCACPLSYTGQHCEIPSDYCTEDQNCFNNTYCNIQCRADNYPIHTALLEDPVVFTGNTFVRVDPSRYPDFSGSVSMFAVFRQTWNTSGYLVFFGTSGDDLTGESSLSACPPKLTSTTPTPLSHPRWQCSTFL